MSSNLIARWDEEQERDRLITYTESQVLEPEPLYPGWMNLTSQRSVRAVVISPKSRQIWMATWGGVLLWRQRQEFTYYRYSSEHGMAGNMTSCICVDESERPWVGHEEGGLSYFDGQRWRVYDSLRNEVFRCLAGAGERGGIWAATAHALYYIAGADRLPLPTAPDGGSVHGIAAMLADSDALLIGNDSGLFRLRRDGSLTPLLTETVRACVALARDRAGRVWVGASEAVCLMSDDAPEGEQLYDGRAGRVREIAAGKECVWLSTTHGVSQIRDGRWQSIPPPEGEVLAVQTIAASSSDDYLWLGTDRVLSGLYFKEEGRASWDHQVLPLHAEDELSNVGRCVAACADGRVWLGTAGGLITCTPDDVWSLEPAVGDVRALCLAGFEHDGAACETLWLQTWPRGYSTTEQLASPPEGLPVALAAGHDGRAYALTSRGLWRLGGVPALVAEGLPPSAHCLAQMPDGAWWVGTTEGVYRCAAGDCRLANERPGPQISQVYALAVINNVLWVAAETGLWARAGQGWAGHGGQEPRRVCALAAAGDAPKLWLAQEDAIVRYDPAARTIDRRYTPAEHGLSSLRVSALVESAGRLWVATQAGMSRLKLSEEENAQ